MVWEWQTIEAKWKENPRTVEYPADASEEVVRQYTPHRGGYGSVAARLFKLQLQALPVRTFKVSRELLSTTFSLGPTVTLMRKLQR